MIEAPQFCEHLQAIHEQVKSASRQYLLIAEPHEQEALQATFEQVFSSTTEVATPSWDLEKHTAKIQQGWLTNSQVNFCAKAYPNWLYWATCYATGICIGRYVNKAALMAVARGKTTTQHLLGFIRTATHA